MITVLKNAGNPLLIAIMFLAFCGGSIAAAGEADIVDVKARQSGNNWSFDVTVLHDDKGWDHYADKWDVVALDGTVLGTRVLAHPHENEQPFTRSLSGVEIPENISSVTLRAHDSVHEYGGKEMTIDLPR